MMSYKKLLENVYRKDCFVKQQNEFCVNCEKGANSVCDIYQSYNLLYNVVGRLDPIPVKHVVYPYGICPNCSSSVHINYHCFCPECGQALEWGDNKI